MANWKNPELLLQYEIEGFDIFYQKLVYRYDPAFFGRRPIPNQKFDSIEIDAEGFRKRQGLDWKNKSEYCLLLGDSVTFGVGVLDATKLLSSRLENILKIPVLDLSTRAFRVEQQLLILAKHLAAHPRPSRLYLWAGYCDLLWWILSGGCIHGHFGIDTDVPSQTNKLMRRLKQLTKKKNDKSHTSYWKHPQWQPCKLDKFSEYYANQVELISRLCQSLGIRFQFLFQPMQMSPHECSNPKIRQYCESRSSWILKNTGLNFEQTVLNYRRFTFEILTKKGIQFLDCQELVNPSDFYDQVHLRPESFHYLADKIALSHIPSLTLS